jgi:hypothetical protein
MVSGMPPLAHVSHYAWVLYAPPILIVVGSIIRTKILERRRRRGE